ncbi:MAG: SDR family oxidoreductase [Oscillospiraceae bacterium]
MREHHENCHHHRRLARHRGRGRARVLRPRRPGRLFYEKEDEKAQAVAAETGAQAVRCDVADEAAVRAAFSQLPGADVLINNAGIADYDLINVITPARWRRLFAVNVDGAFYCIRAALPHMLQHQSGCIINVSSMWGQVGASCEAAYSATKGAILALTKALAQELGPSGIRVNAVAPGVIRTDMCASVDPAVMEDLRQQTPIGRLRHAGGYRPGHALPGRRPLPHRPDPPPQRRLRDHLSPLAPLPGELSAQLTERLSQICIENPNRKFSLRFGKEETSTEDKRALLAADSFRRGHF